VRDGVDYFNFDESLCQEVKGPADSPLGWITASELSDTGFDFTGDFYFPIGKPPALLGRLSEFDL